MKNPLIATTTAVLWVGFGLLAIQQSSKPESPAGKAPSITIHEVAGDGNIEAIKQALAAGANVKKR